VFAAGCGSRSTVPSDALILKLEPGGRLLRNGVESDHEKIVAAMAWDAASLGDPIVLDIDPGLRMRDAIPLLQTLIGKGRRTNIGFRGRSKVVLLPVLREGASLSIRTGRHAYDEGSPQRHLWVGVRVEPDGGMRAVSLQEGLLDEFNAPKRAWPGGDVRSFLSRQDVIAKSPFVNLEVQRDDGIEDFVACLDELHRVAPGRIVVSVPGS
jgi:hypothetical protein